MSALARDAVPRWAGTLAWRGGHSRESWLTDAFSKVSVLPKPLILGLRLVASRVPI